jgi:hypothetical protein
MTPWRPAGTSSRRACCADQGLSGPRGRCHSRTRDSAKLDPVEATLRDHVWVWQERPDRERLALVAA